MADGLLGTLYYLLKANSDEFDSTIKQTQANAEKANSKIEDSFIKMGAVMQTAKMLWGQIKAVVDDLINSYAVQEEAETRLEAVVKATGQAAGFSSNEMKRMASELQDVTTYGDETVLSAQAILATFKSISGDTFPRTIEAAADLSAVFGQSLQQSATMLGKALEDPVAGMGALRRVGVTLSEETQQLVKDFVALGQIEKAQNEILKAVEGQVGGTARLMAQSGVGSLKQMENAFGDLKETMGGIIVDAIQPVTEGFKGLFESLSDGLKFFQKGFDDFTIAVSEFGGYFEKDWDNNLKKALERTGQTLEKIGDKWVRFTKEGLDKSKKLLDDYYASLASKQAEWERKRDADKEAEKLRLAEVSDLNKKYADEYFELKNDEIAILKKKMNEEIEAAKKIGADTTIIKKLYTEQIKQIEDKRKAEEEEARQERLEKEQEITQAIFEARKAGEDAYSQYVLNQTYYKNEINDEFVKAEQKRQEQLRNEYERTAGTVMTFMNNTIYNIIRAAQESENAWDGVRKAALEAIRSILLAFAQQWAVQAAAAWAGAFLNPLLVPEAIGYTTASIAATAAAALIPSLDTGGMLTQNSIIQAHAGEVVIPLNDSLDILVEKLNSRGAGGDTYIYVTGPINSSEDANAMFRRAGQEYRKQLRGL